MRITLSLLLILAYHAAFGHVYVVIYATHGGKTGHAGIAVDQYEVRVRDVRGGVRYDTVRTGRLVYFDVWPERDRFNKERLNEPVPATYFRLPASSAEPPITVGSLLRRGIPHEEGYACDGLLRLVTTPQQDAALVRYLQSVRDRNALFHAWEFNCADFVEGAVEFLIGRDLDADETIFLKKATTPNRLYRAVAALPGVVVIKDAAALVQGSFFAERLINWKP
jgi:hypothetical protein